MEAGRTEGDIQRLLPGPLMKNPLNVRSLDALNKMLQRPYLEQHKNFPFNTPRFYKEVSVGDNDIVVLINSMTGRGKSLRVFPRNIQEG